MPHHRIDIYQIFFVSAVELRQRLRVEVEVVERDDTFARDEGTAIGPSAQRRHEVRRRRKFDVDVKSFLQLRDCPQDSIALRNDSEVDIDCVFAPMFQNSARAASQIDSARLARLRGDGPHEGTKPRLVYGLTHSAARSKLTNLRISAL